MRWMLAPLALALAGCHPTFTFDAHAQGSTTVQGSPLGGLLSGVPGFSSFSNMDFSQSQDFQNQGVTKNDVQSVKVKQITIQLTSPNNEDFSWLDSLTFVAQTGNQQDTIATKNNISQLGLQPPNPQFDMDIPDVELKPYVVAPSMSITSNATGRLPPQNTTLQATITLSVTAFVVK